MKQKAETYKKKRIVMGDENLVTNSEIHIKDVVKDLYGDIPGGGDSDGSKYTGHADAEGLRAIGWTDEDIAYYQENGVNWNEEYDQYHLVSDDNKALYGVLTADNISSYKDRIVYLPKIDLSIVSMGHSLFSGCSNMVAIPHLDTSHFTNFYWMFQECKSLIAVPPLNMDAATVSGGMFEECNSLKVVSGINTSKVAKLANLLKNCYGICSFSFDASACTNLDSAFYDCYSLTELHIANFNNVTTVTNAFAYCYNLRDLFISGLSHSIEVIKSANLTKESLLYIINNEAATSAITIKLASYAYTRLANDADIVAALAAHPNISLAK